MDITQEDLKELLHYDPNSVVITDEMLDAGVHAHHVWASKGGKVFSWRCAVGQIFQAMIAASPDTEEQQGDSGKVMVSRDMLDSWSLEACEAGLRSMELDIESLLQQQTEGEGWWMT
jgi:hypothetical protein